MPSFVTAAVAAIIAERPGLQRVELDNGRRAYVLTQLIGSVAVGDRVVVNITAVDLGLGTGGWDVVHWNLERAVFDEAGPGHIMKLRYTSLQVDAGAAEEHPAALPDGLDGLPVIVCALHSQLAPVAVAFKHAAPHRRLVYVMTDGAALPLAFSDLVADLSVRGLVDATVSTGQAFGGDFEAVNLPSGLRVARGLGAADAVVVAPGPGVVGTNTALGYTGLDVATTIDAVGLDGGRPVVALRYSDADPRPRHRGISHHSTTALERAHQSAVVAIPQGATAPEDSGGHLVVAVEHVNIAGLLDAAGLTVTTMGRGPNDDPGFFAYAAAAGAAAARLA